MRGLLAAVVLFAALYGSPQAAAQNSADQAAAFRDYFAATAQNAGLGARNEAVRQRQVMAALSPLVTQFLIQRPGQIDPMIRGLAAAAPGIAPQIAQNAMAAFPGFASQIAHAAGFGVARAPVQARPVLQTVQRAAPTRRMINNHAARVAAWAASAIAQNPAALEQIMAQAIAAAPGGEMFVIRSVQASYPGFADRIAAATNLATRVGAQQTAQQRQAAAVPATSAAPAPAKVVQPAPAQPTSIQPIVSGGTAPAETQTAQVYQPGTSSRRVLREGPRLGSEEEDFNEIDDPLEPMNRIIFALNDTIDLVLLRPIALGYNTVMPDPAINAVRRFFLNLDAPVIFANDLLQGDFKDAGVTLGRFGVNSTIGVLGLFDPAASFGWERHHADFGQTLHSYSIGAGPYLVLPLLGPMSTRGGVGRAVDIFFQPLSYLLTTLQNLGVAGTRTVVRREELLHPIDELRENSVDYYTGLKAAFWQARQVELNKGAVSGLGESNVNELFDSTN